jgi:hypothetical protein
MVVIMKAVVLIEQKNELTHLLINYNYFYPINPGNKWYGLLNY